ncbi:TonB-dependent receptor [Olivibacter domesticus]|uniref:TonB-linked outer membrane protein, SusC/RagA family n=1 Tax=Olivibacter domesticus TaxID=407022 RepID=A0A1H7XXR4_OLID1|nr:TonB-dependent receptor [Olivibacter domesticus]SEM38455.1 TonB-linked outer membrane protein, SusC/RagA family [Olivibacter domesticus]
MNMLVALATVMCLQTAMAEKVLAQKVSLDQKNATVTQLLTTIEKQTGYTFFYRKNDVEQMKPISVSLQNVTVEDALNYIFKDQPCSYQVQNKLIVLKKRVLTPVTEAPSTHQDRLVGGTITDSLGSPIPGVSVLIKGTSKGTSSNAEGNYQLQAEKGQVLVFRNIGYQEKEVTIGEGAKLDVVLASASEGLEEVVVIGYGSQQRRDVTGSVAPISMENVRGQAISSPDQALTGQVSGVNVSTSNGTPGGGPRIQVRGIGAIGAGSEPLYVIDGFPIPSSSGQQSNPMSAINPQDIASMTVLKDASATAIYGSRGANGVIIITTKRGASGKPVIQFSGSTGLQEVPQTGRPDLMNGQEFAQWRKEAIMDKIRFEEGREPTLEDVPELYRDPSLIGEGTNWFDEVTRVAPMTDLNLSISGGTEKIKTYVSAGYFNQEGVMLNTGFDRFSIRTNVDANLSDRFKVGINLSPSLTFTRGGVNGQGRDEGFDIASPIPPVYNEDGSYNAYIQSPGSFGVPNPVMFLNETTNKASRIKLLMNTYAEYSILDNLKFKTTFNVDYEDGNSEYFRPSILGNQNAAPPSVPSGQYIQSKYLNWLNENTLNYDFNTDNGHSLTALIGFTVQSQKNQSADFTGNQFPDDDIKTLNGAARITGGTDKSDWALISYLARANYSYLDKYLVTATVRTDGSSRFGVNNRWGTFPSLALGWRASQETFLKDVKWLNDLKFRASYGFTGNFNIGNYSYMSNIGTNDYVFNGTLASGRVMNTLGNPSLGWEKMREFNAGVDFVGFNNRLTFSIDYYHRNTQDLLLNVEIPESSGFSTVTENRGDVLNKGLEFALNSVNIAKDDFNWSTSFNISFNRNKVLALGRSDDPIYSGVSSEGNPTNITKIGSPVGLLFGYVAEGIYQNEADLAQYPSFPGAIPGNMRFRDVNGDGQITPVEDFDVIGNPYPDFTWGITNSLRFKNWDFRVLVVGSVGAEMLRATNFYTGNIDGVFNVRKEIADRWRSPEQPGNGKVPTTNGTGRGRVMYRDTHSYSVEKTDYAWIRNITLGYTLPNGLGKNKFIQQVRLYGTVQNAFLFTGYSGNPEGTNYNREDTGALVPGIDYSNYPVPRIFTLGANLTF